MLNVGNYKQFIFESSLDRDNCVKLSSNIGAGGLPGLSCDRGNSNGDPVWAVCAVPRMVMALCEQGQTENGSVAVPDPLRPYLDGRELLVPKPRSQRPNFLHITSAKFFEKYKKS